MAWKSVIPAAQTAAISPWLWPVIIVLFQLWQSTGYGSIVYFAAIMGIDNTMFEAAAVDGASAWQRIRYIILPSLKPTFIILLLFALGGIMRGNFGLFWNLVGNNAALGSGALTVGGNATLENLTKLALANVE